MSKIEIKLPAPVVDTYGDAIKAIDWTASSGLIGVDMGGVAVRLEAVKRRGVMVVRAATGREAMRIRAIAAAIAENNPERYPPASDDDVAVVLAARNPTNEA